jgi:large subunit ribosomal protein L2
MGTPLRSQRRGKGSPTYRAPPRKFMPVLHYKENDGRVVDILKDPARNAPLAKIEYDDKTRGYMVAMEGMKVGDMVSSRVKRLVDISEGTQISCIEASPNSGPKLCRAPGSAAKLVSKSGKTCVIMLPSKNTMKIHMNCMASVGIPAGEGRKDKPFLKAGSKYHLMKSKGRLYPRTSGVAMNAVDHPFGGSGSGTTRSPVSRHTPPGAKVGLISPRGGKKKRR